jgi:hypothetical protein
MLSGNAHDHFLQILDKIRNNKCFGLIRPSDGEYIVIKNRTLTKILIPKCMKLNPDNIYLDVGSTLDVFLKGYEYQREYVDINCSYNKSFCNHI